MTDFRIQGTIDAQNRAFLRSLAESKAAMRSMRGDVGQLRMSTRELEHQQRSLNRALEEQRRHLRGLSGDYLAVRRAVMTMGIRSVVTGFAAANSAAGSLAMGLGAVADQAGLAGTALGPAFVSTLMGTASALKVVELGLDGVGKALTTTGEEHERALDKLTKPQRELVAQLGEVREAYREAQLLSTKSMAPGILAGLEKGKGIGPAIRESIWDTGQAVGYLAEQLGELAGQKSFQRDVELIGRRNAETLMDLGDGAIYALDALRHVQRGMDPVIGHITERTKDFSKDVRDAMREARGDGTLATLAEESAQAWDRSTSIVGDSIEAMVAHMKAAHPVSEDLWDSVRDGAEAWKEYAQSAEGQDKTRRGAEQMAPVLRELGKAGGETVGMLARLAAEGDENAIRMLKGFREEILPLVEDLSVNFNRELLPSIIDVTGELVNMAEDAAPALKDITSVVGDLVERGADVLSGLQDIAKFIGTGKDGEGLAMLAIGAGVLAGWSKFKDLLERSLLLLRRQAGLVPKNTPVFLGAAPGRDSRALGGGPAGSPAAVAAMGGFGGGSTRALTQATDRLRRTLVASGPLPRNQFLGMGGPGSAAFSTLQRVPLYPNTGSAKGSFAPLKVQIDPKSMQMLTQMQRLPPSVTKTVPGGNAPLTRMRIVGDQVLFRQPGANRDLPPLSPVGGVTRGDPLRGGQRNPSVGRQFQRDRGFANQVMRNTLADFTTATKNGMVKGAQAARGPMGSILKTTVGVAGFSGMVSALSQLRTEGGGGLGFLQNFFSGGTFGAFPSVSDDQGQQASKAAGYLQNRSKGTASLPGPAWKLLAPDPDVKIDLTTSLGVEKFRTQYLKALRDGKKITDEQGRELDKAAGDLQRRLSVKEEAKTIGLDFNLADIEKGVRGLDLVKSSMSDLRSKAHGSMGSIRKDVETAMRRIDKATVDGSLSAKKGLSTAFNAGMGAVRRAMQRGTLSVKEGMAEIERLMAKNLEQYGFSPKQARNESRDGGRGRYDGGRDEGGNASAFANARGGLNRVGTQSAGLDKKHVSFIAGEGEDVAVFTRHQRKMADKYLAPVGGLPGLFSNVKTPHGHSAAQEYARGGIVQLGRDLQAQGYEVSEHPAFGGNWRTGHSPTGYHPKGMAIDVNDDDHPRGEMWSLDRLHERLKDMPGVIELLWRVKGHFDHLHVAMAGAGGSVGKIALGAIGGGLDIPKIPMPKLKGVHGDLGKIAKGAVRKVRDQAQEYLASQLGGSTSGGIEGSGSGMALMKSISKQLGWNFADWWALDGKETGHGRNLVNPTSTARLRGQFLDMNWGKYGPGSDPSKNPSMDEQIRSMAEYIKERYGNPTKALAFHEANNWYARGGLVEAATGVLFQDRPDLSSDAPSVNTDDAITPGSSTPSKAKKKKAKKKPKYSGGPSYPELGRIKGRVKKNAKGAKVAKWLKALELPSDFKTVLDYLPNLDELYENPLRSMFARVDNLSAQHGLTSEDPTASLYDSAKFADLTAWLQAHPEMLGGKSIADFKNTYGDQLEVVNTRQSTTPWGPLHEDGLMVQGRKVLGVGHALSELRNELTQHTGGDAAAQGGIRGMLAAYRDRIVSTHMPLTQHQIGFYANQRKQLVRTWTGYRGTRRTSLGKLNKLRSEGYTWQERVADNDARREALEKFLADLKNDAVGHKLTEAAQKKRNKAQRERQELADENQKLKEHKPAPRFEAPKRRPGESAAAYRNRTTVARRKWQRDKDERERSIKTSRSKAQDARVNMRFLSGESLENVDLTQGLIGQRTQALDTLNKGLAEFGETVRSLNEERIPQHETQIAGLIGQMNDWAGTSIAPPPLATDTGQSDAMLAALKDEQLKEAQRQNQLLTAQFGVFKGFAPLAASRLVGAFAHGTRAVDETGLALVHKGERIFTDPDGPFRRGENSLERQLGMSGSVGDIVLELHGGLDEVIERAVVRVGGKQTSAHVSGQLGRRQRLIGAAPGR